MVFNYTIVEVPENFTMSYKVMCLRQRPGKKVKGHRVKKGSIKLDTTPHKGKPRRWCHEIYNNETEADACTSFYVLIEAKMDLGEIHLSEFQFGRPTICLPKNERRKRESKLNCSSSGILLFFFQLKTPLLVATLKTAIVSTRTTRAV